MYSTLLPPLGLERGDQDCSVLMYSKMNAQIIKSSSEYLTHYTAGQLDGQYGSTHRVDHSISWRNNVLTFLLISYSAECERNKTSVFKFLYSIWRTPHVTCIGILWRYSEIRLEKWTARFQPGTRWWTVRGDRAPYCAISQCSWCHAGVLAEEGCWMGNDRFRFFLSSTLLSRICHVIYILNNFYKDKRFFLILVSNKKESFIRMNFRSLKFAFFSYIKTILLLKEGQSSLDESS